MSSILVPDSKMYRVQKSKGEEFDVIHTLPLDQKGQHCLDMVNCDCECCYPEIDDRGDQVFVNHKWIQ